MYKLLFPGGEQWRCPSSIQDDVAARNYAQKISGLKNMTVELVRPMGVFNPKKQGSVRTAALGVGDK